MAETKMQLVDWLDDLCVRFIINLPQEELASPERICFQIEEAQWFYEDFIRPLDPRMPSMHLRKFCSLIFQHCPLLAQHSHWADAAYEEFLAYKTRVPVRGAIMLNDDMSEVVLVKGWKKGAKWSFPRGKINKDEKDLDCAIREVYEETGFEIREAGLVPEDESQAKYIDVSLRDQHMRLYVFRSVPMDTHFEPRTRKEISKISWYKLADLPTQKKEKQQMNPKEEALKGSHFYMVAPFIRQLKVWIKEQNRLDKMHGRPPPRKTVILDEDTDQVEEDIPYVEAPSADETQPDTTDVEDPNHFNRLLSGLGGASRREVSESANLPEVSPAPANTADLAAELKRMLSVGGPAQTNYPQSIPQEKEANPLLNMLRGPQQPAGFIPPHTPAEQMMPTPPLAHTPHHQHPRPPPFSSMPPPPNFPFSLGHGHPVHQHPHGPRPFPQQPPAFSNGFPQNGPPQGIHQTPMPPHGFQNHGPPPLQGMPPQGMPTQGMPPQGMPPQGMPPQSMQPQAIPPQGMPQAPKAYQRTGDPQFAPQYPQYGQPTAAPPASRLPPPKLTSHAINLLNVFKSPAPQVSQPAHPVHLNRPSLSGLEVREKSVPPVPPQQAPQPQTRSDAAFSSPELLQPQAQKPRSSHKDALLNLFRAPSTSAAQADLVPPPQIEEPVELAAHASPHLTRGQEMPAARQLPSQQVQHKLSMRHLPALNTAPPRDKHSPGLTSATVSGPLNAPDFATVRKNQKPAELGSGTSPSAAAPPQQQVFQPTSILSRAPPKHQQMAPPAPSQTPPVPIHTVNNRTMMEAPRPFHPLSILKRQEEGMPMPEPKVAPPQPVQQMAPPQVAHQKQKQASHQRVNSFDRRDSAPTEQKQQLLHLFGVPAKAKPTPPIAMPRPAQQSAPAPPANDQKQQLLNLFSAPKPTTSLSTATASQSQNIGSVPVSAFPGNGSGVNSPVSPLPTHATLALGRADTQAWSHPTSGPAVGPTSAPSFPSNGRGSSGMRGGSAVDESRSRISSITSMPGSGAMTGGSSEVGGLHGMISRKGTADGGIGSGAGSGTQSPITPKEKNFLLDYLMGVAAKGAPAK